MFKSKTIKTRSAYQWGKDHDSCKPALKQRKQLGKDKTQADWWRECPRGDWLIWLIWQLDKLPKNKYLEIKPPLLKAIYVIVDRAVRNHALDCGCPVAEKWAKKWLDRKDVSIEAAAIATAVAEEIAATAAESACAAAAEEIEVATAAAEIAAVAAASITAVKTAAAEEYEQQADDIRKFIPEWPGEL